MKITRETKKFVFLSLERLIGAHVDADAELTHRVDFGLPMYVDHKPHGAQVFQHQRGAALIGRLGQFGIDVNTSLGSSVRIDVRFNQNICIEISYLYLIWPKLTQACVSCPHIPSYIHICSKHRPDTYKSRAKTE